MPNETKHTHPMRFNGMAWVIDWEKNATKAKYENETLRQQNAELVRALEAMLHGLRVPTSKEDHNAEREEACAMARAILATVQS
jgi:hypothetical protein